MNPQRTGAEQTCSAATRAALEQLQREGNWDALVRGIAGQVQRAEAEDLVSRSFERALTGLCQAEHVAGVHAWIAQDVRFALSHHHQHEKVVRRALEAQQNALPRPGEEDGAEVHVARKGNAELAADLLETLSKRDQKILRLSWGEGEKRPAVAEALGVSPRIVKRTLFKGGPKLEGALVERLGGGCGEEGEQLVRDFVFGRAGGSDRAQAMLHMRGCESCRELHGRLQEVRVGVAAVAPAPFLAGLLERGQAQVEHVAAWVRDQFVRIHSRTIDLAAAPQPLPRPGALLANIGVCVVAAGGTYCVSELPPLSRIDNGTAKAAVEKSPPPAEEPSPPPPAPEPAPAPQPAPPPAEPDPGESAEQAPKPDPRPADPVAEPALQFPTAKGAPQQPPAASRPDPAPADAPASGGPEFP